MSIKVSDMVKTYDGSGDVSVWLAKVKLVISTQKLGDIATIVPLFLDGPAFAVYDQMEQADKKDGDKIQRCLLEAFSLNAFQAYDNFRRRSWMDNEPVDVFLSELRKLARLAGVESDDLLRCAFVVGLPSDVSSNLRASVNIKSTSLCVLVEQARVLMSERIGEFSCVAAQQINGSQRKKWQHNEIASSSHRREVSRDMKCFKCNENGHISRNCPKNKDITCFSCGKKGHYARHCVQGNDNGESHAPTTSPMHH